MKISEKIRDRIEFTTWYLVHNEVSEELVNDILDELWTILREEVRDKILDPIRYRDQP